VLKKLIFGVNDIGHFLAKKNQSNCKHLMLLPLFFWTSWMCFKPNFKERSLRVFL